MEKIKQLMLKSGVSEEAASQICEHLEAFSNNLQAKYKAEYNARLDKAKKVCIEQTEAHKAELSRRTQVFLEAKTTVINEYLKRQAAQRGTEADAKLEKIVGITEGIEINGQTNTVLKAELAESKRVAATLLAQRNAAKKAAERVQGIANKLITRNKLLESKISNKDANGRQASVVSESRNGGQAATRLDGSRRSNQTITTRRTIKESVDTNPPPAQRHSTRVGGRVQTPDEIAELIDANI